MTPSMPLSVPPPQIRIAKKAVRDLGPDGLADVVPTDQGSVPSLR